MNKAATSPEKPYVDPFLYEVGFFKDASDREKMIQSIRKVSPRPKARKKTK